VQIDAVNLKTGQITSTQTTAAGGYQIALPAGSYRIIASVNNNVIKTVDLNIGDLNVEQDFILSGPWQGGSRDGALTGAQSAAAPAPVAPRVQPQPVQPQPVQPQPTPAGPVGVVLTTWNWTSWKANVK